MDKPSEIRINTQTTFIRSKGHLKMSAKIQTCVLCQATQMELAELQLSAYDKAITDAQLSLKSLP